MIMNLWLSFLLVYFPLLMAPKGKFLLQKRGGKKTPQKRRAEGCKGGSNLQGAGPLEQTQGCWRGSCSGGGHPPPLRASRLGFPAVQASGELHRRVQIEDVPPNPQRPSNSGTPGAPLGPIVQRCAWWQGARASPLQAGWAAGGDGGPGRGTSEGQAACVHKAAPEQGTAVLRLS